MAVIHDVFEISAVLLAQYNRDAGKKAIQISISCHKTADGLQLICERAYDLKYSFPKDSFGSAGRIRNRFSRSHLHDKGVHNT
jgi:hypothetical protein